MDFLETISSNAIFIVVFAVFLAITVWATSMRAVFFRRIAAARGWNARGLFEISAQRAGLKMTYGRTARKYMPSYHYFSAEGASGLSPLAIKSPNPEGGNRKFEIKCDESMKERIAALMEGDGDAQYFTSKAVGIELAVGEFDLLRAGNDFKVSVLTGNKRRIELRIVPSPQAGAGGLPEMKDGQENEYGEMIEHGFALLEKIAEIAKEGGA